MNTRYLYFILFLIITATTTTLASENPRWSVIIYTAFDEEEVTERSGHLVEKILKEKLPQEVEILLEHDAWGAEGVKRYIHTSNGTILENLPEHDSANPLSLNNFIQWAQKTAKGEYKIFLLMTHSWGWKGTIQDFTIPIAPDPQYNTMMPLREFSKVFVQNGFHPDILFLDTCNLGNAEIIHELKDISRYLITSERETPFNGFPYSRLFSFMGKPQMTPRELARILPKEYVKAHSRSAKETSLVEDEQEYDVVTSTALDLAQWDSFAQDFKALIEELKNTDFKQKLKSNLDWPNTFHDNETDSFVDVVEFLNRLQVFLPNQKISKKAKQLLTQIGYPEDISYYNAKKYKILPTKYFEILIQADEILFSKIKKEKALERLKLRWEDNNKDLELTENLKMRFRKTDKSLWLIISGHTSKGFTFRPWLPGTKQVKIKVLKKLQFISKTYNRKKDYLFVGHFPKTSFLLSEAHTHGAPFIHGIGITLKPEMDYNEERAFDPYLGLKGPDLYRKLKWNEHTGWADLVLLN